jgi:hypothetical protein
MANRLFVDGSTADTGGGAVAVGDDTRSYAQAQNPNSPWASFTPVFLGRTEVQTVVRSGAPASGTFTLTIPGYGTTAAIATPWGAAEVQAALNALPGFGSATVGLGANTYTVTFTGFEGDVPLMTSNTGSLVGATLTHAVTTEGSNGAQVDDEVVVLLGTTGGGTTIAGGTVFNCNASETNKRFTISNGSSAATRILFKPASSGGEGFVIGKAGNITLKGPFAIDGQKQQIVASSTPTAGSFTITVPGFGTTGTISAYTSAAMQTALQAISGLGSVTVALASNVYTVTFTGVTARVAGKMTTTTSSLVDGSAVAVTLTTYYGTLGQASPGTRSAFRSQSGGGWSATDVTMHNFDRAYTESGGYTSYYERCDQENCGVPQYGTNVNTRARFIETTGVRCPATGTDSGGLNYTSYPQDERGIITKGGTNTSSTHLDTTKINGRFKAADKFYVRSDRMAYVDIGPNGSDSLNRSATDQDGDRYKSIYAARRLAGVETVVVVYPTSGKLRMNDYGSQLMQHFGSPRLVRDQQRGGPRRQPARVQRAVRLPGDPAELHVEVQRDQRLRDRPRFDGVDREPDLLLQRRGWHRVASELPDLPVG